MSTQEQAIRDIQHFGEEGGVVPVIDVAATSTFLDPIDMARTFQGELQGCYLYSRHSNPTVSAFGKKLAAMEGMESALGVASGMAAIAATIEQLTHAGSHIIASRVVYGGTYALFKNVLPKRGVRVSFVDIDDLQSVESAITPDTCLIYTETLSNPLLRTSNLKALGALAKKRGLRFVVDNTFTPLIVSPARFGADVVIHSCTKYISGSSDLIAGAIVASESFIQELIDVNQGIAMLTGPVMDPRVAHELYMRLDHLPIRMRAHSASAHAMTQALVREGVSVIYPGLPSHPQFKLLNALKNDHYGYGGMLVVDCATSARAVKLATRLQEAKFGLYAVSLGFSRTLISCPSVSTSSEIPEAEQKAMELSPALLRLSIGYTGDDSVMIDRFMTAYRGL